MGTFESSVVIRRPVEDVFAFLANPDNETQWQKGLIESKLTSERPLGVGAQGHDVRKSMGMKMTAHWEVTEFEPNQRVSFKVTKPTPFTVSKPAATGPAFP